MTDAQASYNERTLAEIQDRHDEWRANHYYLDVGFLLSQLDAANQMIAEYYDALMRSGFTPSSLEEYLRQMRGWRENNA